MEHTSLFRARINIALYAVLLCYGLLGNYAIYLQLGWPGIITIGTVAAVVGAATCVYGSKWRFSGAVLDSCINRNCGVLLQWLYNVDTRPLGSCPPAKRTVLSLRIIGQHNGFASRMGVCARIMPCP